ncbi:MAG: hypothetical protein Q8T08_16650 [Ignavibacteria bacterium]|nr:hypothetical protein [Ignavibacteria bacterium]
MNSTTHELLKDQMFRYYSSKQEDVKLKFFLDEIDEANFDLLFDQFDKLIDQLNQMDYITLYIVYNDVVDDLI